MFEHDGAMNGNAVLHECLSDPEAARRFIVRWLSTNATTERARRTCTQENWEPSRELLQQFIQALDDEREFRAPPPDGVSRMQARLILDSYKWGRLTDRTPPFSLKTMESNSPPPARTRVDPDPMLSAITSDSLEDWSLEDQPPIWMSGSAEVSTNEEFFPPKKRARRRGPDKRVRHRVLKTHVDQLDALAAVCSQQQETIKDLTRRATIQEERSTYLNSRLSALMARVENMDPPTPRLHHGGELEATSRRLFQKIFGDHAARVPQREDVEPSMVVGV